MLIAIGINGMGTVEVICFHRVIVYKEVTGSIPTPLGCENQNFLSRVC
jgi:hypothetical protein